MSDYDAWIEAQNLPSCPAGLCHEVAQRMRVAFPELTLVRGHFQPYGDDRLYPHWWLTDAEGAVVDPTAAQFGGMAGAYLAHVGAEPTGRCLDCGLYVFNGSSFCTSACAKAWQNWMNTQCPAPQVGTDTSRSESMGSSAAIKGL